MFFVAHSYLLSWLALFIYEKYELALVEMGKTYCYTYKMCFTRFMYVQSFSIIQRELLYKTAHVIFHNQLKRERQGVSHLHRSSKDDATCLGVLLFLLK